MERTYGVPIGKKTENCLIFGISKMLLMIGKKGN